MKIQVYPRVIYRLIEREKSEIYKENEKTSNTRDREKFQNTISFFVIICNYIADCENQTFRECQIC